MEEELFPCYRAKDYYPMKLGKTFQERYKVIGKLGYGTASTVWLCRDLLKENTYVALKVYINNSKVHRELEVCQRINKAVSASGGQFLRLLLDSFEVDGPDGKHICLVFEPLGNSLAELREGKYGPLPPDLVRPLMRRILVGLQYLHEEAHVVHTDLQSGNMLLTLQNSAMLTRYEQDELLKPSPYKERDGRFIYLSRPILPFATGLPKLSDFSEARFGEDEHTDLVMPNVYRAPEVILEMPWSYPIDIWAYAMVIWDLIEPRRLFSCKDEKGQYSEEHHLAEMVALLGPPPLDFLQRSSWCEQYWDKDGAWIGDVPIPEISLDSQETMLQSKDKAEFLDFLRKMLTWKPEDRSNCEGIYLSEWLLADILPGLIASGQVSID